MRYWLMKTEPTIFSVDDLAKKPDQTEPWDGVRNYQARNLLRNEMRRGDFAFFYHSSCKPPGIAGIVEIVREGYPDPTAFDLKSPYYDPKTTPEKPQWYRVDVRLVRKLKRFITLEELKQQPALSDMTVLRKGNRLSVMPMTSQQWQTILEME